MVFETMEQCLEEIGKRYNSKEKVRKKLKNFLDILEIKFLDTSRTVSIMINGAEGIEIKDKTETPDALVKINFLEEKIMMGLFNKELGAVDAYSNGSIIVVKGKIKNLLKMRSLLF